MKPAFHTASQFETSRLYRDADACSLRNGAGMPGQPKDRDTHHD
jgi:hypothetical protein